MKANTMAAVVVLACLAGSVARAEDGVVVLRFETANEADARRGIARGINANSAEGYAELIRMTTPPADMTPEQAAKWHHAKVEHAGAVAGRAAMQRAGIHGAKLGNGEIIRRAKDAAKNEKIETGDRDTFIGGFVAVFTTARMNARTAGK
jgi:hypothetical protein